MIQIQIMMNELMTTANLVGGSIKFHCGEVFG